MEIKIRGTNLNIKIIEDHLVLVGSNLMGLDVSDGIVHSVVKIGVEPSILDDIAFGINENGILTCAGGT